MTASPDTKNDLILGAFSQLRISGITIIPSAPQQILALRRLENTIAELFEVHNVYLPYSFEDDPDFSSPHNLPRGLYDAVEVYLAVRLAPDYGKQIPAALAARCRGAIAALFKYSARIKKAPRVNYPSRMPRGKTQSWYYYSAETQAPIDSKIRPLYYGDRTVINESFLTKFGATEVISSYTVEADTELTVNSHSNDDYSIEIDLSAVEPTGNNTVPELKLVITTDEDRILTRIISFNLLNPEI